MKYGSRAYLFADGEAPRIMGLMVEEEIREIHLLSKESAVGNIYRGHVKNVLPAMDCAFVDFGEKDTGYLPMKNVYPKAYRKIIKGGDAVIVEVKKAPLDQKRAVLSMDYSLRGEHLVLLPKSNGIRVSKRIDDEAIVKRLKGWAAQLEEPCGMIIRTEARICRPEAMTEEYRRLSVMKERIEQSVHFLPPTQLLLSQDRGMDFLNRYRDLPMVINDKKLVANLPGDMDFIVDPSFSIRSTAKWRSQWNSIFMKTIPLPSGGNVVIERAEAAHVIDVNMAAVKEKGSFDAMRLKVNREAAEEIAKQIRLRNLSGMIVVDFVHGMDEEQMASLSAIMQEELSEGPMTTTVYGFSAMGLFEIARQRKELSFEQQYREAENRHREAVKNKLKRDKEL
ncbi:MAG: ribonuclease E/G [Peptoniphilus sp.]|nr:ribonuclease E/G [Peptoniphilus sp.]MDY3118549.1 ribonuclease E/G [Peptoniphilus sp.]